MQFSPRAAHVFFCNKPSIYLKRIHQPKSRGLEVLENDLSSAYWCSLYLQKSTIFVFNGRFPTCAGSKDSSGSTEKATGISFVRKALKLFRLSGPPLIFNMANPPLDLSPHTVVGGAFRFIRRFILPGTESLPFLVYKFFNGMIVFVKQILMFSRWAKHLKDI